MFFQEKYSVTTTTNFDLLHRFVAGFDFDMLVIDGEPSPKILSFLDQFRKEQKYIPVIMTYVFTIRYKELEASLKPLVDYTYYKPFDLFEVSKKVDLLLQNTPVLQHR